MREASCLDSVQICLIKEWSCEKLPSALVRTLTIESECIMLCVPAKVQWQSIRLCGGAQLDVKFEDVGAFVKVPMSFHFASEKPFGRSWLPLDAALVQTKPEWVSKAKQINCQDAIYSLRYEHISGMFEELRHCTCGACIACLNFPGP